MSYIVLLFYKYIDLKNSLNDEFNNQKNILLNLNLKGRILIANEGINGTLCGNKESCDEYIKYMNNHSIFNNIDFKESYSDFICFSKLAVKIRNEIVSLGENVKNVTFKNSQEKIKPEEFHEILKNKEDVIVFDTRNNYESKIGKFESAITPNINNSKEFNDYFEKNKEIFENKDVIMYCTGGVRCERISAILSEKKITKRIRHIDGGIHRYVEKYPDGYFKGRNYVFDDRISIKITDDILSNCEICKKECDLYNNCLNAICNKHYICCDDCLNKYNGNCSFECKFLTDNKKTILRELLPSRNLKINEK